METIAWKLAVEAVDFSAFSAVVNMFEVCGMW
jgi:hypothetical protein